MSSRPLQVLRVAARRGSSAAVRCRLGLVSATRRRAAVARELRLACEQLGPAFVKLGQLVSVRPDLFSAETVFEMQKLQDEVEPLDEAVVRRTITSELGASPESLFSSFCADPVASASIAQVHRATLRERYRPVWGDALAAGASVAVKVVRPEAGRTIEADLAVAGRTIGLLKRFGFMRRVDLSSLLDEFASSLRSELDLRNEGRVADRFSFDFRDDPAVLTPRVVWPLTTRRVLTMEYVEGWRLSELDQAALAGVDARALAIHGATAFMRQVLVHGRFHADLHPANIFVTPDGRIAYLDFGIVGRLTPREREHIAQVLVALAYGDADRALRHSAELGVEVPAESLAAVTHDLSVLIGRTLGGDSVDVRHFGVGFLALLGRHGIGIPVGYGLLVKSLVTVEGVARALYPEIDILDTAKPFATGLVAQAIGRPSVLAQRLPRAIRAALRELVA